MLSKRVSLFCQFNTDWYDSNLPSALQISFCTVFIMLTFIHSVPPRKIFFPFTISTYFSVSNHTLYRLKLQLLFDLFSNKYNGSWTKNIFSLIDQPSRFSLLSNVHRNPLCIIAWQAKCLSDFLYTDFDFTTVSWFW